MEDRPRDNKCRDMLIRAAKAGSNAAVNISKELWVKFLQTSAKTKQIMAGVFVALCAVGALVYYISIPKLSDVERYEKNHDAASMVKLITKTMRSEGEYKNVQDVAIQALTEMKDEKGNDFLIDSIVSNESKLNPQEKEDTLEALVKNDQNYVDGKADELFDYVSDGSTDVSLKNKIMGIVVKNSDYVRSNSDKLFNYAIKPETGTEVRENIIKALLEDNLSYVQRNPDKMTEYVLNIGYDKSINRNIIEALVKSNPNYIQTEANKILVGAKNSVSDNEAIYDQLLRLGVNDDLKKYMNARILGNIGQIISGLSDEKKVLETVMVLDQYGGMPSSIKNLFSEYNSTETELKNFYNNNSTTKELEKISAEISAKRKQIDERTQVILMYSNGRMDAAINDLAQKLYLTDGPNAAMAVLERYNQSMRNFYAEYYSWKAQLASLEATSENLHKKQKAEREYLENRKISLYNQIKNTAIAFCNNNGITVSEVGQDAPVTSGNVPESVPTGGLARNDTASEKMADYVSLKTRYNDDITALAQEINTYININGSLKGANGIRNKCAELQKRIYNTKSEWEIYVGNSQGESDLLLKRLFDFEYERISALVNGIEVGLNGSPDYTKEFQKGTKAAYEFDDADEKLKAVLK